MRLTNSTILFLPLLHMAAARLPEEAHQLTTTTHGHIIERADPVSPGASSIADSTKSKIGNTSPAGGAGLKEAPKQVTLQLITDFSGYYVKLDVGTPAKTFSLTLDTGSSDTWIVGSGELDPEEEWYDPEATPSAKRIEGLNAVTMKYMSDLPGESTTFNMYTDIVIVDDLMIRNVPIGAAQTWSDQSLGIFGDGILALGLPSLASSRQKPFFSFLVDEGVRETSILTLGGFDPMAMDGEFVNLEVHSDLHWLVLADSISVDGVPTSIVTRVLVVLDTGTSMIVGSLNAVRLLHSAIPGSREDPQPTQQGLIHFSIPCDSTAVVTIVFAGQKFQIFAEQLTDDQISGTFYCLSNIAASVGNRAIGSFWILGLPFLQTVYTKFTLPQTNGSPAQVSFARLKELQWLPGRSPADLKAQEEASDN